MMKNYLQIMQESLMQKLDILSQIEEKSKEQGIMAAREDVTLEEIDANMDEKSALIDKLTQLDAGFEALFDNIRKELLDNKDAYKEQIRCIQELVSEVMAKSASIEALEARNKAAIEEIFRKRRKELQHRKNVSSAANSYYKTANKLSYVNPQFLDRTK